MQRLTLEVERQLIALQPIQAEHPGPADRRLGQDREGRFRRLPPSESQAGLGRRGDVHSRDTIQRRWRTVGKSELGHQFPGDDRLVGAGVDHEGEGPGAVHPHRRGHPAVDVRYRGKGRRR
jgi:hypothetical protein